MRRLSKRKKGLSVDKTMKGKVTRLLVLVDGQGPSLRVSVDSVQRADDHQIEPLLAERILDKSSRLLMRHEPIDHLYYGFTQLACMRLLIKRLTTL